MSGLNGEGNIVNNVFLLTGKPRMGKTTMIKKLIHEIGSDRCGGFYTEEIRDSNDRTGFRCVTLKGESLEFASVNSTSSVRVGRYGIDIESFESFAVKSITSSLQSKKITVIDEIGFMQMLSASFQELIYGIVAENRHVILGTIPLDSHPAIDPIKKRNGIKLIDLHEDNRDVIQKVILREMFEVL